MYERKTSEKIRYNEKARIAAIGRSIVSGIVKNYGHIAVHIAIATVLAV